MKNTLLLLTLALTACANPADTARLSAIVDTALDIAVRRGAITAQDAADVRDAKTVVIDPATEPVTPSGK